ncbi:MAG: hypothetical protein AAGC46_18240 [Solirubrobacteraceae bacterium]|nr:hypothetical protein [Patulibacter sp.]
MARRATIFPSGEGPGTGSAGLHAPADVLLALLKVDQADVLANREGRLGTGQRRNRRRANVGRAAACGALGVFFLVGARRSVDHGGQWFVPVLIGVVCLALAALFAYAAWHRDTMPVRCLVGPAEVILVSVGRGGVAAKLVVGGESCGLPSLRNADTIRRDFEAQLRPDMSYRVYVVGQPGTAAVVAIEPD